MSKPAADTVLAVHRGYTITNEPYGSEPFTIYTPDGQVLDHCDEQTTMECCDTIDVIENEREAALSEQRWSMAGRFYGNYPETYSAVW